MHFVVWNRGLHRLNAFLDDLWIFLVQEDPETEDTARMLGDASIAQVEAQQVDVSRPELAAVMLVLPACHADLPVRRFPRMAWQLAGVPVPDGWKGDTEALRNSPCPEAVLVSKSQSLCNCGPWVHLGVGFRCGEGDSNPHVLSDTTT